MGIMALSSVCGYKAPSSSLISNFSEDNQETCGNFSANSTLALPPFAHPATNLGRVLVDDQGKEVKMNFDHGTTTLGFKYQGGVLLAVDSRATGGMYIGSGSVKKIIEINKFLLGTMAGGAADCTYWERVLSNSAGSMSCVTGRGLVWQLPVSFCRTWRTTTRGWVCPWA